MDLLLQNGIDIIYQSKWGKIKGRILSAKGSGVITRLAQYSAFGNLERRLAISKSIIDAKINNQMSVVRKYKYHDTVSDFDEQITAVKQFTKLLDSAETINEVMGVEGISARYYWNCFRDLLKTPVFMRREYRPSPDYVNALLNLGYAFLSNEISTCLLVNHFDLELGFLHSVHYGRNSLSLDMMEEFRAPFIDTWLLTLLNKNQIKEEHFHMVNGDWRLTESGFYKFCELYYARAEDWHGRFQEQAKKLKNALLKGEVYEPYRE
jgi:CRISPR-associated protein Cas1